MKGSVGVGRGVCRQRQTQAMAGRRGRYTEFWGHIVLPAPSEEGDLAA